MMPTEAVAKLVFLSGLGYDCAHGRTLKFWRFCHAGNESDSEDLGSNPHVISAVLSAIPHILSVGIAQYIASDVIKLMNSAKAAVRIKVVCVFFHICGSCSSLSSSSYLVSGNSINQSILLTYTYRYAIPGSAIQWHPAPVQVLQNTVSRRTRNCQEKETPILCQPRNLKSDAVRIQARQHLNPRLPQTLLRWSATNTH